MLGSKISNALKNNRFAISFMHVRLRREHKEDYLRVEGSRVSIGLEDD